MVDETSNTASPAFVMALAPSPILKRGVTPKSLTNSKMVDHASVSSCEARTAQEAKNLPVGEEVPENEGEEWF